MSSITIFATLAFAQPMNDSGPVCSAIIPTLMAVFVMAFAPVTCGATTARLTMSGWRPPPRHTWGELPMRCDFRTDPLVQSAAPSIGARPRDMKDPPGALPGGSDWRGLSVARRLGGAASAERSPPGACPGARLPS